MNLDPVKFGRCNVSEEASRMKMEEITFVKTEQVQVEINHTTQTTCEILSFKCMWIRNENKIIVKGYKKSCLTKELSSEKGVILGYFDGHKIIASRPRLYQLGCIIITVIS